MVILVTFYLSELQAERRDRDLPKPPQDLQRERRCAAGQELDERQELEVIISDEELQQDVQRAGENAVRNGHGDPQKPALQHIHGGLLLALKKVIQETQSAVGAGGPRRHSPGWRGSVSEMRGRVFTHSRTAAGRRNGRKGRT